MAKKMMTLSKAAIGAATAGAMLSALPAQARDRHHDRDGISAGEVIAGAVILGGLAAILSDNDGRDNRRYDDRYDRRSYDDRGYGDDNSRYGYNYQRYGNARQAVNRCVWDVEQRSGRWGRTDVTEIRDIERTRSGYVVKGRVVVRDGYGGRWGNGGYYDRGKFSCLVRYGRVEDVRFSGLR